MFLYYIMPCIRLRFMSHSWNLVLPFTGLHTGGFTGNPFRNSFSLSSTPLVVYLRADYSIQYCSQGFFPAGPNGASISGRYLAFLIGPSTGSCGPIILWSLQGVQLSLCALIRFLWWEVRALELELRHFLLLSALLLVFLLCAFVSGAQTFEHSLQFGESPIPCLSVAVRWAARLQAWGLYEKIWPQILLKWDIQKVFVSKNHFLLIFEVLNKIFINYM